MRKLLELFLILIFLFSISSICLADEGMWLLSDIKNLSPEMKARGMELSPDDIYNPQGGGLSEAVLRIDIGGSGGTGSFVSPKGLILTNHHVAFDAIQRQSSTKQDYVKNGFLAPSLQEEIPAPGYYVLVLKSFKDVTDEVKSAVDEKMSDMERYKAIEKKQKEIIKKNEVNSDIECKVAEMMGGTSYYLFTYLKIKDVRIVYIPPLSIGEYGGDIDNWMWPRHTGDFSFLRAYVAPDGHTAEYSKNNVPYSSAVYLKISSKGYKENDFTMIMGYPGYTARYRDSYSIRVNQNEFYPLYAELWSSMIRIMEDDSKSSRAVAIKLSDKIKSYANSMKNYQGSLEGFKRSKLLERKINLEKEFLEYLKQNSDKNKLYGDILPELEKVYKEFETYTQKEIILSTLKKAPDFMDFAYTINKLSLEKEKPDLEREPGFQDRDLPEIEEGMKVAQRNLVPATDKKIFVYLLSRAVNLPKGQKIEAVEKIIAGKKDKKKAIEEFAGKLYTQTKLGSLSRRLKMLEMSQKELRKLKDPFIEFAGSLEKEVKEIKEKDEKFSGALNRLRPRFIRAIADFKGSVLYPDANSTMRLNFGKVKGYSPGDAVYYDYVTTLKGVMEKDTGIPPFDAPKKLLHLFETRDFGHYLDKSLGDVPVNFLADNDAVGGNSGSPVMNGKGQLIGVLFDGNYEALPDAYVFTPAITRSIFVDIRYILFILDKFSNAGNLLKELMIDVLPHEKIVPK